MTRGRTLREAIEAGDWYELERLDTGGRLSMPGCRGLRATLRAAGGRHRWPAGTRVRAQRVLPGSQIGCMYVEDAGEHVIPPTVPAVRR